MAWVGEETSALFSYLSRLLENKTMRSFINSLPKAVRFDPFFISYQNGTLRLLHKKKKMIVECDFVNDRSDCRVRVQRGLSK